MATQNLFDPNQFTPQSLLTNATFPLEVEQPTPRQRGPVGATGLFADGFNMDVGLGDTRTRSQVQAGTNLPSNGDQFTPNAESFNAMGFETEVGSQDELMQNTAETMSNLKTGKPVTPKQASEAASVIKEDNISKGGPENLFEEVPEGVDKSVWESFNSQFDLTTIGLTLMATNGNGQNLAANMGLALQAGMESRKNESKAKTKEEDRALSIDFKKAQIDESRARIAQMSNPSMKNNLANQLTTLNTIKAANDITEQQAEPNVTEKNVAKTDTRKFFGLDVDDDLDPEEAASVKSFEDLYSASQAGVRNGLKVVNINGLSRAEQTALTQMVMIKNNPALLDTLGDNGFGNVSPEIQSKLSRLLATPNGEALLSSLTSTTF
jgi:hypothetical protein